jgi:hypothetical protein
MLAPREFQSAFRRALLERDALSLQILLPEIDEGALSADERLDVYRNNVFASLTEALEETFPAVCRLVDERFFAYAAREFISLHPPGKPALIDYGAEFPGFLSSFQACRDLQYLPDVARFEWLMNVAAHAPDADAIAQDALASFLPEQAPNLALTFHPSHGFVASAFPIDRIWRANRPGANENTEIDLAAGGVKLEVSRRSTQVVVRKLDKAEFAFRDTLSAGHPLGIALERAFAEQPDFAAADAVSALFAEGAIVAVSLYPAAGEQA